MRSSTPHNPAKTLFHQRVHREGRWEEYCTLRVKYKSDGIGEDGVAWKSKGPKAWMWAAYHFPPLDGSDHEITFGPEFDAVPLETPEVPPLPKMKHGNWTDFRPESQKKVETTPAWKEHIEVVKASPQKAKNRWQELARKVPADRRCGPIESVQWVKDNAGLDIEEIDPETVSSRGDLRMLELVQKSDPFYASFLEKIWSRVIPDRKQIDAASRFADDGRVILSDLDAFDEEFAGVEFDGPECPD
jgi:hypothetical protein